MLIIRLLFDNCTNFDHLENLNIILWFYLLMLPAFCYDLTHPLHYRFITKFVAYLMFQAM